jgi:arylsulfatase
MITADAKRWLRIRGRPMQEQGKPWFLAANLVNPHDVMFYNTDGPGQAVQDDGRLLMKIAREPDVALYRDQWDVALPESRKQAFDAPGRPRAHWDYQLARGAMVGNFPNEDERWRRLQNYYINCIRQTDALVVDLLSELDDLGLSENTIIVMTADHGELGGAHGTHGKGATAYQEQNHVPLIVAHPGYAQSAGKSCAAVTSQLDIAPTLAAWSGAAAKDLHGRDFTSLLAQPEKASPDALRPGSLYCFNMYAYLDSDFILEVAALLNAGKPPETIKQKGLRPDMRKRGAIRSVFDGRYKFTRYFSPLQHNAPRTIEEILGVNDVELFDLDSDPNEMDNLVVDARKNADLMLAMSAKLNTLIEQEVGEDDGRFLPVGDEVDWAATKFDP